jgi:branched-chain amino acid transport system ATP-binding protein
VTSPPSGEGLTVRGLHVSFGRVAAVRDVSFEVPAGGGLGIIGANGAGKSSTLKAIFRQVDARADVLAFQGVDLRSTAAHHVVDLGIGYVPEGRRVFPGLTVRKNLLMGAYRHRWRSVGDRLDRVHDLFPALARHGGAAAGALSGGQQQMLAIGRALMSDPRLMVLDEPSMGLAPVVIREISDALQVLRGQGMGILLVEQNAKLTFTLADRCVVLENGEVVKEGSSGDLRDDPEVRRIYLGI